MFTQIVQRGFAFQVFCKRFAPDDQIREGNVAQCTADMQRCRQSDQYCRVVLTCNLLSMLKVKDSPFFVSQIGVYKEVYGH